MYIVYIPFWPQILYSFYNFQLIDIFGLCKNIFGTYYFLKTQTHTGRNGRRKSLGKISIQWRKQQIKECHWNWVTTKFFKTLGKCVDTRNSKNKMWFQEVNNIRPKRKKKLYNMNCMLRAMTATKFLTWFLCNSSFQTLWLWNETFGL